MIHFLIGENSFEIQQATQDLVAVFAGRAEKIDGSELAIKDLPDLLMSTTLFSDKRLVIIKNLSENGTVWPLLSDWLLRVSDDIDLIFIDAKPDKRTSSFKALKAASDFREFPLWTERDTMKAESWVTDQASLLGLSLDKKQAHLIVERVGMDQWELASALEKLSLLDEVSVQTIEDTIDPRPVENVFNLFEVGLKGDKAKVHMMIRTLELTEEPYKLFALLSSQAFQLAAIQTAESSDNPVKDFGIHPFVVSKLSSYAKKLSRKDIQSIIHAFATADADMKLSKADPWLLIERTLLTI